MCVCICIYMYIHMYVYIYIYICIAQSRLYVGPIEPVPILRGEIPPDAGKVPNLPTRGLGRETRHIYIYIYIYTYGFLCCSCNDSSYMVLIVSYDILI